MKKLWISMVVVAMALASRAAVVTWAATETLVAATVRITANGDEDEAWNTSDTLMSAYGSNPGYKGAFWSHDSNAAGEADIGMLALQNAGLTPLDSLRVVTRSTTTGGPAAIQTMFGIDTTALADTDTLSALSAQRVLGGTGADTGDVRWFVEAGSSLYVSEVMGTAGATESNFSLDSTTALEWFSFDGTANISTAIGSSIGTDTLANLGWSNINAAGLYFDMVNTVDANHTGELATFSTTAVPEPATVGMLGLGALITLLIRRMRP